MKSQFTMSTQLQAEQEKLIKRENKMSSDKKISIAIVEDNVVIRDNVNKYISYTPDVEVAHIAGSVEAYLHHLNTHPNFNPDVILLDIGLPGMSGLDAIPLILDKQTDVDIIMLTTFEEEEYILKALCSGAVAYISKKSSLSEILDGIRIVHQGGSYMSPQIAREIFNYIVRGSVPQRNNEAEILSARQSEILEKLVEGKTYKQISKELDISLETVRSHIKKLYKALHVNNKAEAITMYLRGNIK